MAPPDQRAQSAARGKIPLTDPVHEFKYRVEQNRVSHVRFKVSLKQGYLVSCNHVPLFF